MPEPEFTDFALDGEKINNYDESTLQGTYSAVFRNLKNDDDALYIAEATFSDSTTKKTPPAKLNVFCK